MSPCKGRTEGQPHMKVNFPCASTKPSLDQLFAALASMPRYPVLPPSKDCARSLVGTLSPCQVAIDSDSVTGQVPEPPTTPNLVFGGLAGSMSRSLHLQTSQDWVWLCPCQGPTEGVLLTKTRSSVCWACCVHVEVHQTANQPHMKLFRCLVGLLSPCPTDGDAVSQARIICLVGLLPPCQGPTDGQAHIKF